MTLENQVTNLEISKRLKELGVKQNGLFFWEDNDPMRWVCVRKTWETPNGISAFTVAELGEMLPEILEGYESMLTGTFELKWIVEYRRVGYSLQAIRTEDESEANARGKMLIYLLENKLI